MTHEELATLAGAYALGALDGEELQTFRAHLPGCWECRQRVQEFEEVQAEGSLALPPVKPAPELKGKLLARISGQGPVLPPEPPRPAAAAAATPAPAIPVWVGLAIAGLGTAAVACALLWLGARGEAARLRGQEERFAAQAREREALAAQVAQLEAGYGEAHARLERLAVELQVWRRLLRYPDARVDALRGTAAAPGAVGRVLWHENQVALVATALPPLPEGQVYALWAIQGQERRPAGLFPLGEEGTLVGLAALPAPLPGRVDAFAVTPEPTAGGPAPTGAIVLQGQVQ
jgi:anti-sigma-K factor RskA